MSDDPDWIDELYAEGKEELPPPELDEKIRAAARHPVRHPWYRNSGRLAALATAASLVIAVSVIYFEPAQQTLQAPASDAPIKYEADRMQEKLSMEADETELRLERALPVNAPGRSISKSAEAPDERQSNLAEQKSTAPASHDMAQPAPAAPVQDLAEQEVVMQEEAAQEMAAQKVAGARVRAMNRASEPADVQLAGALSEGVAADMEGIATELAELCGPLPGSEETRTILTAQSGWLVVVTVGSDVRRWRCVDGAWIESSSEQQ